MLVCFVRFFSTPPSRTFVGSGVKMPRCISRLLPSTITICVVVSAVLFGSQSLAQNTTGQWSSVITLPYIPVHAVLLPSGKVYFYSYYADSLHPQVWDPVTGNVTAAATAPYELFCSGQTILSDGRLFITGGHIADYTGYKHAIIYDPVLNTIKQVPDMNAGRWYPTNTVLPNGDVLVVSGDETSNTTPDPLPQVYQLSTNSWRNLTTAQLQMPLYPVMFVAPNGKVFNAGPGRQSRYLSTSSTGVWSNVASMNFSATRDYGPGVMYERGKVLEVGGSQPPTATSEIIDLNATTPAWRFTGNMHYPRRQHNAVIMPDGKVFVIGGGSANVFDPSGSPVYPTELWSPASGTWTVMASISKYRGYHSTALLLPDGRVISAGGNVSGPNMQIFSPPWMVNKLARPTISSAPSSVHYNQVITVSTPDAASIRLVTWIRLGATTHTFDQSQRFLHLSFAAGTGALTVTTPANANLSPPGYYMLFLLNSSGVPSVAKIVRIS